MGKKTLTGKDKKKIKGLLTGVLTSFIGMLMALSWSNAAETIINIIQDKFPYIAILGAFSFAFFVTFFGVSILFFGDKMIEKLTLTEEEEKIVDEQVVKEAEERKDEIKKKLADNNIKDKDFE